eukprot:gb/GEZN01004800.1/.p1 GENE.gb/GEZN01004800.1/~~gb/GEZN01004800.1/.p1  ORF type:complete len:560 (-),score=39.19 gb/GEZN01004800.1/:188-1867(-)
MWRSLVFSGALGHALRHEITLSQPNLSETATPQETHTTRAETMEAAPPSHAPSLLVRQIHRVNNISYDEFRNMWSRFDQAVPIVFDNSMNEIFDPADWTRESFQELCGDVPIMRWPECGDEEAMQISHRRKRDYINGCHCVRFVNESLIGKVWAGLQVADVAAYGINTLSDFLHKQNTPEGSHLYLHDAPLNHYCPALVSKARIPKYFPYDLRYFNSEPRKIGDREKKAYHPGIFIGKKGSGSPLHSDSKCTRFYMLMLSGAKLWRLAPPSETWRLGPNRGEDEWYPLKYAADLINPDFQKTPQLDGTLVYETILRPGQVLFVPEMWAHQVENLEDSISTSLNWVDKDTLPNYNAFMDYHIGFLKYIKNWDEAHAKEMEKLRFNSIMLDLPHPRKDKGNLGWSEYFGAHELTFSGVPNGLYKWLAEHDIDEPLDDKLRTALHMAVWLNMKTAARFLVDQGADIEAQDIEGITPLELAGMFQLEDMSRWLRGVRMEKMREQYKPRARGRNENGFAPMSTMPPPPTFMPPNPSLGVGNSEGPLENNLRPQLNSFYPYHSEL